MLDGETDIRTRYAAWVTEGDVLASVLSALQRPTISSVVPLALRRDLRKDRDIIRRSLVTRAIEILNLGPTSTSLLAEFLDVDTKTVFEKKLLEFLQYAQSGAYYGAFKLLLVIANEDSTHRSWALSLVEKAWPTDSDEVFRVISISNELPVPTVLRERIYEAQLCLPAERSARLLHQFSGADPLSESPALGLSAGFQWLEYFIEEGRETGRNHTALEMSHTCMKGMPMLLVV
jgi:hypothetical protein